MIRRESRPNRIGQACVYCGVVPDLRMKGRVCPDCADVRVLFAEADRRDRTRDQRRAADRLRRDRTRRRPYYPAFARRVEAA